MWDALPPGKPHTGASSTELRPRKEPPSCPAVRDRPTPGCESERKCMTKLLAFLPCSSPGAPASSPGLPNAVLEADVRQL